MEKGNIPSQSNIFYDIQKAVDYNAFIYFLIGGRGCGKTFSATKYVCQRFIKKGEQFVYIRRRKTDMEASFDKFFDDMKNYDVFPGHEFRCEKDTFYIDGEEAGYAKVLSTDARKKSVPMPRVVNIIFDEFMLDVGEGSYLREEPMKFLNLMSTILRMRKGRIFMISNAISVTNPYFTYFNISPNPGQEFKTFQNGDILVQIIQNSPEFMKAMNESPLGRIIQNTEFGKFAIENNFLRDSKAFVKKKTGNCYPCFNLIVNHRIVGIWSNKQGEMYISDDHNPNLKVQLTLSTDEHSEDTMLISKNSTIMRTLEVYFRQGMLFFENINLKNEFMSIMTRFLTY